MNNVLSLLQTARRLPEPQPALYSEHMLAELLSLHGDMIEQLRLEQLGSPAKAEFLALLIEQHKNTAAMLRAKLETGHVETKEVTLPNPPARPAQKQKQPHYKCLYFAAASLATLQAGTAASPPENSIDHSCIQKSNSAPAAA